MVYFLEYVWVGGLGELRSKIRVMRNDNELSDLTTHFKKFVWNYDGSSCGQATTEDSEILLHPVALYRNPLLSNDGRGYLVFCESVRLDGTPARGSNYHFAESIFHDERVKSAEYWFGIEQEYFFVNPRTRLPFDFVPYAEDNHEFLAQGQYYCGVGGNAIYAKQRDIAESHMKICLEMSIPISGINAEVAPNQWEYQVGPCVGMGAADDLWVSRYILKKIAESHHMDVTFHPKPIRPPEFEECWNGSGAHTNVSTRQSRSEGGIQYIRQYMKRLEATHHAHLEVYGEHNELRLTGKHETGRMGLFTYGVGTRNTSIRIPHMVVKDGKGYFEDRRPASNMDPYLVCGMIAKSITLEH